VKVGEPLHVPFVDVSVEPADVSPDITGGDILTGGAGAGAEAGAVGTIALLIAVAEPLSLVAVTLHVIACPISIVRIV
jgi:hypothetical protein